VSLRRATGEEFLAQPQEAPWDLSAWQKLCLRIDAWAEQAFARLDGHYRCHRGCHHCCRRIASLLPVEWAALHQADAHPVADGGLRSDLHPDEPLCGLLASDGSCLRYAWRPVICRTHGHALLLHEGEEANVDFCPWNFQDVEELEEEDLVDLDRLNEDLLRANALFLRHSYPSRLGELWQWRIEWQADSFPGR
jgi:Fe-S-cluster containining protein